MSAAWAALLGGALVLPLHRMLLRALDRSAAKAAPAAGKRLPPPATAPGSRLGGDALAARLDEAGLPLPVSVYLLLCLVAAIIVALAVARATGNPTAGIIAAPLGWIFPGVIVDRRIAARRARLAVAIEGAIDQMAHLLAVRGSAYAALAEAAGKTDEPLRSAFHQAVAEFNAGRPLADALDRLSARFPNPDLQLFALAVGLHARHGGPVGELVRQIAATVRERRALRAARRAETAGQALTVSLLLLTPPALFAVILAWAPDFRAVLQGTAWGRWAVNLMVFNEVAVTLLVRWLLRGDDL